MNTNKTAAEKNSKAKNRRMEAMAERVRQLLDLETLQDRKRDALDFHDISVASIREAIGLAFEAGYDAGFDDAGSLTK